MTKNDIIKKLVEATTVGRANSFYDAVAEIARTEGVTESDVIGMYNDFLTDEEAEAEAEEDIVI